MSNFKDSPKFSNHDDYYTPLSAWKNIYHLIPEKLRKGVIFEAFMLNSNEQSKRHLTKLGLKVIGSNTINFLEDIPPKSSYDLIMSNPPFDRVISFPKRRQSKKYQVLEKLFSLDKPFIIIMNSTNLYSRWWSELVGDKKICLIIPSQKINYSKYEEGGKIKMDTGSSASFNSVYVCYKVLKENVFLNVLEVPKLDIKKTATIKIKK